MRTLKIIRSLYSIPYRAHEYFYFLRNNFSRTPWTVVTSHLPFISLDGPREPCSQTWTTQQHYLRQVASRWSEVSKITFQKQLSFLLHLMPRTRTLWLTMRLENFAQMLRLVPLLATMTATPLSKSLL
jgi:hypothetical protein